MTIINMRLIISILLVFQSSNLLSQDMSTNFPQKAKWDYNPDSIFVKKLLVNEDSVRIWVKGAKSQCDFEIKLEDSLITKGKLSAPFYIYKSKIFSNLNSFTITIGDTIIFIKESKPAKGNYSILSYGCFQPFSVKYDKGAKKSIVAEGYKNGNFKLREAFHQVTYGGLGDFNLYFPSARNLKHYKINSENNLGLNIVPRAELIIGTGDQIYVDAGYKYTGRKFWLFKFDKSPFNKHPLSAWDYSENPSGFSGRNPSGNAEARYSPENYSKHLNLAYNGFYSFKSLNESLSRIPSINVWDDHEIRDGWGSNGDEYVDGEINEKYKEYFKLSKKAFQDHQFSQTQNVIDFSARYTFRDFRIFTLDLRTYRNVNDSIVLGDIQKKRFEIWCNSIDSNKNVIIVSSIPFFYGPTKYMEELVSRRKSADDDVQDGWGNNLSDREFMMTQLIKLREKGCKPIILAGDVHMSGSIEVFYTDKLDSLIPDDAKVLCYEIVSSGLSHETMDNWDFLNSARIFVEFQKWSDNSNGYKKNYRVYPEVRKTTNKLNFSTINYKNGKISSSMFIWEKGEIKIFETLFDWTKTYRESKEMHSFSPHDKICNKILGRYTHNSAIPEKLYSPLKQ